MPTKTTTNSKTNSKTTKTPKQTKVKVITPAEFLINKKGDKIHVQEFMILEDIKGYYNPAHSIVITNKGKQKSYFPGQEIK